jgi:hypothetical protein
MASPVLERGVQDAITEVRHIIELHAQETTPNVKG